MTTLRDFIESNVPGARTAFAEIQDISTNLRKTVHKDCGLLGAAIIIGTAAVATSGLNGRAIRTAVALSALAIVVHDIAVMNGLIQPNRITLNGDEWKWTKWLKQKGNSAADTAVRVADAARAEAAGVPAEVVPSNMSYTILANRLVRFCDWSGLTAAIEKTMNEHAAAEREGAQRAARAQ